MGLRASLGRAFSRDSIVQNVVWLLVIAALSLVWPTLLGATSNLTWRSLIPLGVAGFLLLSAALLVAKGRDPRLGAIARQLGTELRDIRHKIEIVKSTRPHPHYSHGFQLPAFRWDELDDELASYPALYRKMEGAYTAAHHVNEALMMRRTRAGEGKTIGVIPDDGLDEAYEAAGEALDELGESRGRVWESGSQRAVRLVTEDILRDADEGESSASR